MKSLFPMRRRGLRDITRCAIFFSTLVGVLTATARGAPATHFIVSNDFCGFISFCPPHPPLPLSVRAGDPFGVYIAAVSENGGDRFYTGTVTFSSSDPTATLPPAYTFVPGDEGAKGFTVILRTVGEQTITVADISGALAPGTLVMTVTGTASPAAEVPTLTPRMLVLLALLLGSVGLWLSRPVE